MTGFLTRAFLKDKSRDRGAGRGFGALVSVSDKLPCAWWGKCRERGRGRDSCAVRTKPVAAFKSRKLAPRGTSMFREFPKRRNERYHPQRRAIVREKTAQETLLA